ncbi:signal peptidase I [Phycisphaera mikurensis]|uniref:Signal peptidase I n=1 Tax=Phycisphaera mikurensis (strain NBRC 102666 / KCTC 22515 / FYK2301M01) TaxID=1142394 RepID=I0IID1_PHYMF|nr:signal peptidase I [Phycisphaera mikurensis]MBB6442417.1 signal peptidase I [Phycisphaera mikurensis]BAM05019.1 signal peptidase I [Phycisphaera mikurensis NBRC 102666]
MEDEQTPAPPATPPAAAPPIPARREPEAPRGPLGVLWHEWVKPLGTVLLVVMAVRSTIFDWNDVPSGSMRPTILEGDRIVVNKLAYGLNAPFNGPNLDVPFIGVSFANPLDFLPGWSWAAPKRGDTVTFWNPTPRELGPRGGPLRPGETPAENPSSGIRMVKRIVALPGETVEVIGGRLKITAADGTPVPVVYAPNPDPDVRFEDRGGVPVEVQPFLENLDGRVHAIHFLPGRGNYRDSPPYTLADRDGLADDEYYMVGDNRDNSRDGRYYQEVGHPVRGRDITGKALFVAVSFDGSLVRPVWSRFLKGLGGAEAEPGATPTGDP